MNAGDRARIFIGRGWRPVPIPAREKGPRTPGWNKLRITNEEVPAHFAAHDLNVGVLLGDVSPEWLVDVDLDVPEAVDLAKEFLPHTEAIFGRQGNQRSHWLYYSRGARTNKIEYDAKTLVELRSTGLQTVFPGSTHPSGELIEWVMEGEPATVDPDVLEQAVRMLGEATKLVRMGWERAAAIAITREGRVERTQGAKNRAHSEGTVADAVAQYNAEHRREFPRSGGDCPGCGHRGCFGRMPGEDQRWYCFSSAHSQPGLRGQYGWHGDVLDLDAHAVGITRIDLLRRDEYLIYPNATASTAAQPAAVSDATTNRLRALTEQELWDRLSTSLGKAAGWANHHRHWCHGCW